LIFSILDKYARSTQLPSAIDSKTAWLGSKEKTMAKYETLEHPFFQLWQDFLDNWAVLNTSADDFINQIRIRLLKYLQEELPKEKLRRGVLSFDDLLLQLQSALRSNPQLALDIRKKYKAALIDEFQDTDPIQYEIFSRIFSEKQNQSEPESGANNRTVFLVGDPKQAIYSFRGGDIHTYLKAKADTSEENHYTLETNWRSHKALISAFNILYQSSGNPFRDKGIDYIKVSAGNIVTDALITPDNRSSLRFWQVGLGGDQKKASPKIREEISGIDIDKIVFILNPFFNIKILY